MRIVNSSVFLHGASASYKKYTKEESVKFWIGNNRPGSGEGALPGNSIPPADTQVQGGIVTISQEGREAFEKQVAAGTECVACVGADEEMLEIGNEDRCKIYLIQRMIEYLTGKKLKFVIPRRIRLDKNPAEKLRPHARAESPKTPEEQKQGWGLEYDLHETHYEKHTMSFSAGGVVKTADGREIAFDLELNLGRKSVSRQDISIRAGDAAKIDPLVINYESDSAALTGNKYSFDIDCDGTADQISFATAGSGFLAIDANGDGVIRDGSELFGPQSGNGFAELAVYDGDGNGWIDENDGIYDRLRIWTRDEYGNDRLFALGAKGIGAICLGSAATAFELKSQGSIARSGIFLKENGTAGTIQHVDLAV